MRSFSLAALLLTLAVASLVLIALNALEVPVYSRAALDEFTLFYRTVGWAKYLAPLLLLSMAHRAVLRREYLGWHRGVLLWSPLALFVVYAYLQWGTLASARVAYLARHGRPDEGDPRALLQMLVAFPVAFAVTAIHAGWSRRRELRLTSR